jgi:hypothetical protein
MSIQRFVTIAAGAVLTLGVIALGGRLSPPPSVHAQDNFHDHDEGSLARIGLEIAPVPLNLEGKDPHTVGLGSYIVNAVADCNACHSAGPATEFTATGNPYLLSPPFSGKKEINPATYLGGGQDFGPFPGPPLPSIPHLYSRNLTPNYTGLPEGGHTFEQFRQIMRHGTDFDHVHPNCTSTGTPANCLEPPFNGDVLQVMPWPAFENMTDHDLWAIYEYLSAVPCNPGPGIPGAPYLQNVCD